MSNQSQLEKAQNGGFFTKLSIYGKMSGPGWIQAAVTLGGGSLVGALYLGVIGGFEFLWLQPLAMLCGIIMLAAISYVTLSTEERPFRTMQKKVSPTLAWGWLIATLVADTVFCMAQFSLAGEVLKDNLGVDFTAQVGKDYAPFIISGSIFILGLSLISISQKGTKAAAVIDNILKILVGIIVLCFMAVVVTLISKGAVQWGSLFSGLIPDFSALFRPTEQLATAISKTEDVAYWTQYVTGEQRGIIIAAFGTAVGINMTFLLPYNLRQKGWGKAHRELSRFDLMLGLFVPFFLGTSALVIASAASFHAKHGDMISADGKPLQGMEASYYKVLDARLAKTTEGFGKLDAAAVSELRDGLPLAEKQLAAMLSNRGAKNLATSLEPFLGKHAQWIFGTGVFAMAFSTLLVHMMMNGFAISEAFNKVGNVKYFIAGASMPALAGLFSPAIFTGATKAAMQIPASIIATTLLPIAYLGFFLLMNSRSALGNELPKKRFFINALMLFSTGIASLATLWVLSSRGVPGYIGLAAFACLAVIGITGFLRRNKEA